MKLELENDATMASPTAEMLERKLRALRVPGRSFAILEKQAGFYMQTAKNEDGSFALEFQLGSLARHYELPGFVGIEDVVEAFRSYLQQDDEWLQKYEWKQAGAPGTTQ